MVKKSSEKLYSEQIKPLNDFNWTLPVFLNYSNLRTGTECFFDLLFHSHQLPLTWAWLWVFEHLIKNIELLHFTKTHLSRKKRASHNLRLWHSLINSVYQAFSSFGNIRTKSYKEMPKTSIYYRWWALTNLNSACVPIWTSRRQIKYQFKNWPRTFSDFSCFSSSTILYWPFGNLALRWD